jgi:V8-like Glu-specific endopeptidase
MKTSSYAKYFNLCSDEKFYDQQQATWCSGFLIAPDLIATAGHCINSQAECEKTSFVFGFKKPSEGETVTTFQQDAVFQCKELIARTLEMSGADFAIVRLDRPTNRAPLSLSKKLPSSSDELVVIGHPSGLSTKISGGAFLRSESNGFFVANTDTYGGNSGSAVFNAATGEVEGILVRGERDFVWRSTCKVSKKCADDECRGEDITKIAEVIKNLPAQ